MLFNLKPQHLLACLMSACIVTPAFAQQENQSERQRDSQEQRSQDQRSQSQRSQEQRDRQSQQRSQNQEDRQSAQQRDSRSQDNRSQDSRSRSRVSVVPQGWVSMAVDYDNDGSYDGFETIYIYDLQMAQQRSRDRQQSGQSGSQQQQRMQNQQRMSQRQMDQRRSDLQRQMDQRRSDQQRMNQQRDNRMDSRRTAQNEQQRSPTQRVTGTVQNIKQLTMHDGESKVKVAKVKTQDGRTARVLLGKSEEVDRLTLKDGDKIQVQGRRGRINDRPVLIANSIRSGEQFVQVKFDKTQPLRKFTGSVEQTRTARFQNRDGVYLIARLEGENGESHVVNMGRTGKISPSAVKNADEVCVLATKGKVNGQEALIAEQISIDGRKIDLGGEDRRPSSWTMSEQQNRDQGSSRSARESQQRDY